MASRGCLQNTDFFGFIHTAHILKRGNHSSWKPQWKISKLTIRIMKYHLWIRTRLGMRITVVNTVRSHWNIGFVLTKDPCYFLSREPVWTDRPFDQLFFFRLVDLSKKSIERMVLPLHMKIFYHEEFQFPNALNMLYHCHLS